MIYKKHICNSLSDLNKRYDFSLTLSDSKDSIYFSKLALLEYCGWIEESFDLIILRSIKNKLQQKKFKDIINAAIKKNSGFQYESNFRPMLITAIGVNEVEKLEKKIDANGSIQVLISELHALKEDRNSAAHGWIRGTTRLYPAPSILISRLNKVHPIIKSIYSYTTML